MKKFVISMFLLLSVISVVFANGGKEIEFDPTPTKFEGERRNANEKYSDYVYVFSGNRWQFTNNDESKWGSGYFTFTKDTITLYKEDGKKWWNNSPKYRINNAYFRIDRSNNNWAEFLKQPVEKFVTSGEIFDKLQGSWKATDSRMCEYIFFGNEFIFNYSKNNFKGTFEMNSGLLKLIIDNDYALFICEFTSDNMINIECIYSSIDYTIIHGYFNKS
jgi:hypothetical protein